MAICPNCGANTGFANICPFCGTPVGGGNKQNNSDIDRIKEVTQDFTQKPSCSDSEFKELVVKALASASISEKNTFEARIKAYADNYLNGGSGIVKKPIKGGYASGGVDGGSSYSSASATTTTVSTASTARRRRRGGKKLAIILICSIGGGALLLGCTIAIPLAVRAAIRKRREKEANSSISTVSLRTNYPNGDDYVYTTAYIEYGDYKSVNVPSYYDSDYRFTGYYTTNSDFYGEQYFDESGYATQYWDHYGGSVTLYAHWEYIGGSSGGSSSGGYSWTNSGSYGWTEYSTGNFRSNNSGYDGSTATMVITFNRSGTFYYSYRVSSEPDCDYIRIYYDGYQKHSLSGQHSSYTSTYLYVSSGYQMKIEYSKDWSSYSGEDTAYFRIDSFDYY